MDAPASGPLDPPTDRGAGPCYTSPPGMKASYGWIRALLPALDASPRELAERFTSAGLEVEGITEYGLGGDEVVVARVRRAAPHPGRSGLTLVTVEAGARGESTVVCGASNVPPPGGLVALAKVGVHLPAVGRTIEQREIGGVASAGMLCSEAELGLVEPRSLREATEAGILVLPEGLEPGTSLARAVPGTRDSILDVAVTPNRPDALGHVGLAREAAALFELPFAPPEPDAPARVLDAVVSGFVAVEVHDPDRCPVYGAGVVVNVRVRPSPPWLRYRLTSLGVRPISNVVDVTNLVQLEYGHPMHAFDLDRVRGGRIEVRRARRGEPLETLDGVHRTLDPDDLVIADAEGPVALAGVMGGASSEIGEATLRVLLECAGFAPRGVRRAARRHGLHTESSHRFERGVDAEQVPDVLAHACSLLTTLASGSAVKGSIVLAAPAPPARRIRLSSRRIDTLLGARVPFAEATTLLARLGCAVRAGAGDAGLEEAEVEPPSFRPDLVRDADLVEEVARVRGLDRIPAVLPAIRPQPPRREHLLARRVRREAVALGLDEAVTYAFVSARELAALGAPEPVVRLSNPLGEERGVLRTSILPGLLEALGRARRRGERDVRLFEVGAIFLSGRDGTRLPYEASRFGALLAGARWRYLERPEPVDLYDGKGVAIELVERVTGRSASAHRLPEPERPRHLHPRGAAAVVAGERRLGRFGLLHPDVQETLDLDEGCVVVELDLDALAGEIAPAPRFRPIPRLPAATRDLSLLVHDDVAAGDVEAAIREAGGELCESVELFDLFRGAGVPAEHRSLAFHVVYRDPRAATEPEVARTLTDEEVDARHRAVIDEVARRYGAQLRA